MQENEIRANFARNVRELRLDRKLNQIQLGEKLSYTSKAVSKWENGDVMPDIVTLKMIADFFDISVDALISNKNVIRKSHRKRNRFFTTLVSSLLSFFVAGIVFFILTVLQIHFAWLSFIVAIPVSAIVLIVFTSLWYGRIPTMLSTIYLVIGLCLTAILILNEAVGNFFLWWAIALLGLLFIILTVIFFQIIFPRMKK